MDLKLIRQLLRLMKAGDVSELELEDAPAGVKVRLKRGRDVQNSAGGSPVVQLLSGGGGPGYVSGPGYGQGQGYANAGYPGAGSGPMEPAANETARAGGSAPANGLPPGTKQVVSPMVGTFYRAATPESEAFASVGTRISEGSVLCIVEAMKVMNEIKSEISGEIVRVLVENGEPVEYGQPLFLVKTD